MIPVRPEGDLLERSTSKRSATPSSGRTGWSHLTASKPGDPNDSEFTRTFFTISSIAIEQVCHPLAINPFQRPFVARFVSVCIHCGS